MVGSIQRNTAEKHTTGHPPHCMLSAVTDQHTPVKKKQMIEQKRHSSWQENEKKYSTNGTPSISRNKVGL